MRSSSKIGKPRSSLATVRRTTIASGLNVVLGMTSSPLEPTMRTQTSEGVAMIVLQVTVNVYVERSVSRSVARGKRCTHGSRAPEACQSRA